MPPTSKKSKNSANNGRKIKGSISPSSTMAFFEENGFANSTMTYRSPQLATSSSSASSAASSVLPPSSSTMDLDTSDDLFCPPDEVGGIVCDFLGFWDDYYEKILRDDLSTIRFYMAISHQVEFMISANDQSSIFFKRLSNDTFIFHLDHCNCTVGCNICFFSFLLLCIIFVFTDYV